MYLKNTITIFKTTKAKFTTLTLALLLIFTKTEKSIENYIFCPIKIIEERLQFWKQWVLAVFDLTGFNEKTILTCFKK